MVSLMESITKETYAELVTSLIPKAHIQALDFVKAYPYYDGRQVKIAIWDTGVDPAAEGLQITTEGKPKLTYMCDTSGSGDVSMSVETQIDDRKIVKLISGKTIEIPESWVIKDGIVKLGIKISSEIFPSAVLSRLSKDYKEKIWSKEVNRLLLELTEKKKNVTQSNKLIDKEPEYLIECLEIMEKSFEYPTPVLDCIVFHNDEDYVSFVDCSSLDSSQSIDDMPLLYSFEKYRQYSNFGGKTNLNFGVNIWNDGKMLEIVASSGSHGTHVASITAGYFPNNMDCNGIAPGAEVVSIKISDTRLGSMETGSALALAAQKSVELKCDIINLSFGESCMQSNCGSVVNLMKKLVTKYGIVFCSSAGNNGPALSTVGAPGGTTDTLLGISPMVFADMVESNYSLPIDLESANYPQVYTWASRGPTTDGSWGIHVAAPGSAITSVGNWQNRNIGLMNGSSMSSPNACGGISLLISAARQSGKCLSPWLIHLATANTAKMIDSVSRLSQGYGLLQIQNAFNFMKEYWDVMEKYNLKSPDIDNDDIEISSERKFTSLSNNNNNNQVHQYNDDVYKSEEQLVQFSTSKDLKIPLHRFRIKCTLLNGERGVLLREPYQTARIRHFYVNIAPDFDQMNIEQKDQVSIKMYLHLLCKAKWVIYPRFFTLYNQSRTISIKIDTTQLNRDSPEYETSENPSTGDSGIYCTELEFHCLEFAHMGPLARLPICVMKSESNNLLHWSFRNCFTPNKKIVRHFLETPPMANALLMQINPITAEEGSGRFEIRLVKVHPNKSVTSSEVKRSYTFDKKLESSVMDQIGYGLQSGVSSTVELVISQYWSNSKPAELEYIIDYHGLKCSNSDIKMLSSDRYVNLLIESHLRAEEVSPNITLNFLVLPLRPEKEEISYLSQPVLDYQEIINLNLYYSFTNNKAGEVGIFCPSLGNMLYENDFISQIYHIYDNEDRVVATGDYQPDCYFFRLGKGKYKIKLQIRHFQLSQIEKLKEQNVNVYFKTFPSVSFDFSRTVTGINNNKTYSNGKLNFTLLKGETSSLYISSNVFKVLKDFSVGSYLVGTFSLYSQSTLKTAASYPFQYVFTNNVTMQGDKTDKTNKRDEPIKTEKSRKLKYKFCESISGFIQNTSEKVVGESDLPVDGEVDDENVESVEPKYENVDSKIIRVCTATKTDKKLLKFLMEWIAESRDENCRQDLTDILVRINNDREMLEAQLFNLRAINQFTKVATQRWKKIAHVAEKLISSWDTKELADYCGAKYHEASFSMTKEEKSEMDKNKKYLLEVLCVYGISLGEKILTYQSIQEDTMSYEDLSDLKESCNTIDTIYRKICRFVSPWAEDNDCLPFFVIHAASNKCYGRLLKFLLKSYEEEPHLCVMKLIAETLDCIGWNVLANHYRTLMIIRHPTEFLNRSI